MRIGHLSLTNFRLYARLEADLPPGPLILQGANAQGKTSLLEALYYLATAQSHHAASDRQLIHFLAWHEPQPFARLVAETHGAGGAQRLEIRLAGDNGPDGRLRKEILVNGVKKRAGELAGLVTVVLFLPRDMVIIEGAPADRRRYLDTALSQVDPAYYQALGEYGKVLTQRNALLKALAERGESESQLDFWDEKLCDQGALILAARMAAVLELEALAAPIHRDLTAGADGLRLAYHPAFDPAGAPDGQLGLPLDLPVHRVGRSQAEIRAGLLTRLRATRREEIARGQTLTGPHRDEMRLIANGVDLGAYGSRGQARTAVLALKLAEMAWMQTRTGEKPLLLLDEVLAELDARRRQDLLTRLTTVDQCVLTTTDATLFPSDFRNQATIWEVKAGRLA